MLKIQISGIVLSCLFLLACNGEGGGTEVKDTAILRVQVLADCAGTTGCTRVLIDDHVAEEALGPGGEVSQEVPIGNHTVFAVGGCDLTRIWGPYTLFVPAAGLTQVLGCSSENSLKLTLATDANCSGIERDIIASVDGETTATLQPGGHEVLYVSPGLHTLAARSAGGFEWGPDPRNITSPDTVETFSCNPSVQAPLTVSVSADCPGLDYVQIWVDADYLGQVNCGSGSQTKNYPMGYRTVTAKGFKISQLDPYLAGPYVVYLADAGSAFVIQGTDFILSGRGRR